MPKATMSTRLAERDTINSICGYYMDTLGQYITIYCSFGVPCTVDQFMTPKVAFCSPKGGAPKTTCLDGDRLSTAGCTSTSGQICCSDSSQCGKYRFNGGSTVMLACASTAFNFEALATLPASSSSSPTSASTAPSPTTAPLSTTAPPTVTSSSEPTPDPDNQGLSTAAKVGIGLGVGLIFITVCLIAYWVYKRRSASERDGGGSVYVRLKPVTQGPSPGPVTTNSNSSAQGQKLLTYRVENIAESVTWDNVKNLFKFEERPWIQVRSLAPARFSGAGQRYKTATIEYSCPSNSPNQAPQLDQPLPLVVDKTFEGFTPLNEPTGPIVADVIAVTGLAGHAFGSWAHSRKGMWLRDDLPFAVPNVRIITYGYPSSLQGNLSYSSFDGHAGNFTVRLREHIMQTEARPIILIGHSLGCLLIKQAVIKLMDVWESSDTAERPFEALVPQIIFFGAPHNGLNTDALSTLVGGQPSAPLIQDLTPGSGVLVNLNDKFAEKLARVGREIRILSVVETRKTKTVIQHPDGSWTRDGPEILMVPKSSAVLGYGKETVLESDEDHSRIAKLYNSEGSVYYDVQQTIVTSVKR